jgi:hypothetical protein
MLRNNPSPGLIADRPDLSDRLRNILREAVLRTLDLADHNSSVADHNILLAEATGFAVLRVGRSILHGSGLVHTARPANCSVQPASWAGSKVQHLCGPLEAVRDLVDAQEVVSIDLLTFCFLAVLI